MVTNPVQLTNIHLVASLETVPDDITGVDHRVQTQVTLRIEDRLYLASDGPRGGTPNHPVAFNEEPRPQPNSYLDPIIAHNISPVCTPCHLS